MADRSAENVPEDSAEDFYQHAPCGYLSARPDGTIVRVNDTLLTWIGRQREDVVGKLTLSGLLTIGGRIFFETHVAPLLSMQGFVEEIALDLARVGGAPLPILLNARFKHDENGQPIVLRATLFNVTERRKYERELIVARRQAEAAAQAKSDFVSMISHEIRTPLSAIIGVAHLLKKTELSPQQDKLTSVLKSSADNLLALINDILDFSKIEAGKVSLEPRPIDLRALVEDVAATLRVKADEKKISLVTALDDALPAMVNGDPVKLRQILTNLAGNAIKFTSRGAVTIALEVDDPGPTPAIRFEVRDTGIGIAADRLAHIFEDFTQASYEISVKYGGTGLGLAITRRLVELHGAEIAVESIAGEGSRFWFTLHLPAVGGEAATTQTLEEQSAAVLGMRVLLADDNEVNQFVIGGFLQKWGVAHDIASNGRQAVELVATHEYDLVLMDLRMPELTGYDAVRAIRRLGGERFQRLPIIAVSASVRMGDQPDLQQAGFTDFLGKPVSPDLLLEKLARHRPR